MSFSVSGFDDLEKQLQKMADGAEELSNTTSIPLTELFTPTFMQKCSSFSSFDEFLSAGNFNADTQEAFEAIDEEPFNKYISSTTSFKSWDDMLQEATDQHRSKKLGI